METEKEQLLRNFGEWISFVTDLGKYNEWIWDQCIAADKWTVREVVIHILRWDDYFYEEAIAKAGAGLPLTVKHLDYDVFNLRARTFGKTAAIEDLVRQAVQSRQRIITVLSGWTEEQFTATYQDGDGQPFEAGQYMKDFIWHDQHHINQIKQRIHFRIEEMSLNGWPALQTVVHDGWLLRFANGYTKRSNSISPLYGHTFDIEAKIRTCETLYAKRGIRTVFKITPFIQPASLDDKLASLGYDLIDHTLVKTIHLDEVSEPTHSDIWLENDLSESWLDAVAMFAGLSEEQRKVICMMMEQSPLSKCFAVLHDNGIPVACGLAVIEDGWIGLYDIVTDPGNRNRGFGEQLILHLLQWGRREGATKGYLLVVKHNAPANRLYDKIGYALQYEYWYRVQADEN